MDLVRLPLCGWTSGYGNAVEKKLVQTVLGLCTEFSQGS